MHTYIALLRGINVGGNNKVEMPKLKQLFETLGFVDVSTYINTGNVIFSTTGKGSDVESAQIENALAKQFGFPIRVVLRSASNIHKVIKAIPGDWQNDTTQRTDVLFLWEEFDKKSTLLLIKTNPKVDHLMYVAGAIIWNLKRTDYTKSGMHKLIGTTVYKHMTARNVNTVRKLASLLAKPAS